MSIMWLIFIWTVVLAAALYLYLRQIYTFFSRHGIKSETPFPLLGNMLGVFLKREHFSKNLMRTYTSFPGERFVGRYEMTSPVIVPRDIELIKKIAIKDFEHFLDHRQLVTGQVDPIFGRNLFSLKGQEWKDMRSTLSPAFTSSKMRLMVPFVVEVGDQMVTTLLEKIKESDSGWIDVEVKDLATRYANDIIASCAFGLKVNSQTDRDNEFYKQGLIAATFKFKQIVLVFLMSAFPALMKRIKIPLFSETTTSFFKNLILDTMADREKRNITRPDMIHLLMEAKKGKLTHEETLTETDKDAGFATVEESSVGKKDVNRTWSDNELIAQAVFFFIAGFETISSAVVYILYELAVHPDVQDRLAKEIKETDAKNGGKLDYNFIQDMTYMDMVVTETLRLWPPGLALDRECIKDYNMGKPNDKAKEDYIIRKGTGIQIPTWAIHHDPEFYPNPEKFDPERFSEENKHNVNPISYSPFGLGPRSCIASRFSLYAVKLVTYQLLLHIEVVPGPKTPIPVKLDPASFNLKMMGGHWLRFKTRS